MSTQIKTRIVACLALALSMLAGNVLAQQSGQSPRSSGNEIDGYLASCLIAKNEAEIKFAQFAQQRAQDEETKKFAEKIIDEHQKMVQKLQPIARQQSSRQTVGSSNQTGVQRAGANFASNQGNVADRLLEIQKKSIDRTTQMVQKKLEEKSEKEFDECFISMEIGCHIQQLAELEVLQDEASGQLRQIVQQAKPTVEEHLKEAEQLMKKQVDTRQARSDQ
jgi:predicted outer membrane protein